MTTVLDLPRPTTDSRPQQPDVQDLTPWYRLVSRAAAFTAVVFASMFVIIGVFIGFDQSAPPQVAELLQANRAPTAYRIFSIADIFVWFGIGATLLGFAAVFRPAKPITSALIAACGLGQLAGAIGGSLRLYVVSDLATQYAQATADQQPAIVSLYHTVDTVVSSHFNLGATLYAIAFLLIAWSSLRLRSFPRWLTVWFAASGTVILVLNAIGAATTAEPQMWGLIGLVVFVLALHAAVAIAFWRRGPAPA
jgi:hypothetical protein